MNPIFIVLFVIVILYLSGNLTIRENFRIGCTKCNGGAADHMCHQLAKDNCRIPTWMLNDCWMDTYRECANSCSYANTNEMCNCHKIASERCRSGDDPAEACYSSVHQKCMAGIGLAPDPDRG